MSELGQNFKKCMEDLKKYPVETLMPEDWRKGIKEILIMHKEILSYIFALSMTKQISLPVNFGYSIVDMVLNIAPLTTGQAMVFYQTRRKTLAFRPEI